MWKFVGLKVPLYPFIVSALCEHFQKGLAQLPCNYKKEGTEHCKEVQRDCNATVILPHNHVTIFFFLYSLCISFLQEQYTISLLTHYLFVNSIQQDLYTFPHQSTNLTHHSRPRHIQCPLQNGRVNNIDRSISSWLGQHLQI